MLIKSKLKTLKDIHNLKGKTVLVRLDLNVPIQNGRVTDDYRIEAALPTLNFLHTAGARSVLMSHIEGKGGESLHPVFEILAKNFPIHFAKDCLSDEAHRMAHRLRDGEFLLLENLRNYPGEKANDPTFAQALAAMGDIYVNEAFPVSHRSHASVVGVPQYIPGVAGFRFEEEVRQLSQAFHPPHPFVFILGGAKFDTKLPLIQKFLNVADTVFIGGALANDCFKAQGWTVGDSVVSEGKVNLTPIISHKKVLLPVDVVVERLHNGQRSRFTLAPSGVQAGDKIWDVGPGTLAQLKKVLQDAQAVLWNGPLGNFEIGYTEGTTGLARIVAESKARSIVGGGDTVAAIRDQGFADKFTFLSTGGGAMLDFLVQETLPGIEALKKSEHP